MNFENTGQYYTSINGNIIDHASWDLHYDGNIANLEALFISFRHAF